jgi:hypothetical protein
MGTGVAVIESAINPPVTRYYGMLPDIKDAEFA